MYMLGAAFNQIVKAIFMIPRPWVIDKNLTIVEAARGSATGFSFPSGHTQSAVLMYGGIASMIKKRGKVIIAILAVLLMLAVGFSRMYLGVHTPLDVGVSLVTGAIILLIVMRGDGSFAENKKFYLIATGLVGLAVVWLLIYIYTVCAKAEIPFYSAVEKQEMTVLCAKDAWTLLGTILGLLLGYFVETNYVKFSPKAVWWVQIIKVVVGLAVIIGLRVGLKGLLAMISESEATNCIRYFILAFVGLAVLPLAFKPLSKIGRKDAED